MMRKNKLDEMQEQKMLQIEHNGCWFAVCGLLIAILVQCVIGGEHALSNMLGEWIILVCLGTYLTVASTKQGIWDRRLKPSMGINLAVSVLASLVTSIVQFIHMYLKHGTIEEAVASAIVIVIVTFVLCMSVLSIILFFYKRKVSNYENELEE